MTQLTPMQSLQAKVENHIKDKFAELVPDEVWQGMVQKTVDDIIKNSLQSIIQNEVKNLLVSKIQEELRSKEFQMMWDGQNYTSETMKNILIECAPKMMANIFSGIAYNVLQNVK